MTAMAVKIEQVSGIGPLFDLPTECGPNEFKTALLLQFDQVCKQMGGPAQYLQHKHGEALHVFATRMQEMIPPLETVQYWTGGQQALSSKERINLHPNMLGLMPHATTKPMPYPNTCRALADEILTHGFLTDDDPLTVWLCPGRPGQTTNFGVNFVKGMARSTTLLCLLDLIYHSGRDLANQCPVLLATATVIRATYELHTDLINVAIANANLSSRGSIRAAHDVITWTSKLLMLEANNSGEGKTVLDRFNGQATGRAQVTGNRRVSALNLLAPACHAGVTRMLELLGEVGPEGVFWLEDAWANKRVLPGYCPRGLTSTWNEVLRVSAESFELMVKMLNRQQIVKLPQLRRRLDKNQLVEQSELAAMVMWTAQTCLTDVPPLAPAVEAFKEACVSGEHAVVLDMQGLLHEKKPGYSWRDVECLREAHSCHVTASDKQIMGRAVSEIEATKLEQSEYDLYVQKLLFDVAAFRVWKTKLQSTEIASYHFKLEHKRRRRSQVSQIVCACLLVAVPWVIVWLCPG